MGRWGRQYGLLPNSHHHPGPSTKMISKPWIRAPPSAKLLDAQPVGLAQGRGRMCPAPCWWRQS
eukprot:10923783-Prorocentrum_lima.AAC.1